MEIEIIFNDSKRNVWDKLNRLLEDPKTPWPETITLGNFNSPKPGVERLYFVELQFNNNTITKESEFDESGFITIPGYYEETGELAGTIDIFEILEKRTAMIFNPKTDDCKIFFEKIGAYYIERGIGTPIKNSKRSLGNPGLDHDDLIYRLAKAQEGEEIKKSDPQKTWKEIAREINWLYSVKTLTQGARDKLKRLTSNENIMADVAAYREKEKKKNT